MLTRRLISFFAYCILAACSPIPPDISTETSGASSFTGKANLSGHALLIGISDYSGSGRLQSLEGPKNDIPLMRSLLIGRFGIPKGNITILQDGEATHTKIQKAFSQLAEHAKLGDFVYIYYSGHGSIYPDYNHDEKPFGREYDQTWATYGSRKEEATGIDDWDILDDEIAEWLTAIAAKTDQVVFVSDSCHSGSVSRAPLTEVRLAPQDLRVHPLANQQIKSTAEVGIRIGATRDDKFAYGVGQAGKSYGKFSWYWVEALNQTKPGETWQSVFNRTYALMVAQPYDEQIPQLSGNGNRAVFGGQFVALKPSLMVVQVNIEKKIARFNAGSVSGVTLGSSYRIIDPSAPERNNSPCLVITQVDTFESLAKYDGCTVSFGDNAVEVVHNYTTKPIRLQIKADFPNTEDKDIVTDLNELLRGLEGFQLVDDHLKPDWVIYVLRPRLQNGQYIYNHKNDTQPKSFPTQPPEVWVINQEGRLLHQRLQVSISDQERGIEALRKNLVNFARIQEFKELSSKDAPIPITVKVAIMRADPGCQRDQLDCVSIKAPGSSTDQSYRKGPPAEITSLQIQPPRLGDFLEFSASNVVKDDYYLYLINITPEGGVKTIFPRLVGSADEARFNVGETDRLLNANRLLLNSQGVEMLKIITSRMPINVSLLEREDLQEIKTAHPSLNSLERLLFATLATRGDPVPITVGDWSTVQVEFEVK